MRGQLIDITGQFDRLTDAELPGLNSLLTTRALPPLSVPQASEEPEDDESAGGGGKPGSGLADTDQAATRALAGWHFHLR